VRVDNGFNKRGVRRREGRAQGFGAARRIIDRETLEAKTFRHGDEVDRLEIADIFRIA